ncbi:MAG: diguanylate cyclase [Gammaproteobacteria bacterium]|nr:diguanylate cyclase [Gammaproteobacteria bacterium]MDX5374174.1 diguanylate cyclase [Gammaproteobacteria bacterium]
MPSNMTTDLSIIIVDDMQFSRAVLKQALQKGGYTDLRLAESAGVCLEMLAERSADVVLADWVMPEMNGLELTNAIRQYDEEHNRYTAVILFTGREGNEAMQEAFERGIDDYLTKPVDEIELAARVFAAGRIATLQNTLLETASALSAANAHLEELTTTDSLTGLGNRRYLTKQLEDYLLESHNRGGGVCLAMIDVDKLGDVNEQFGHDVGDEVLVGLARRLRRAVRPTDIVVRTGSDEFGVIMHYTADNPLRQSVFDRVVTAVSQRSIQTGEGEIPVTVSMGVACYAGKSQPIKDVQQMMTAADEQLFKAKEAGGNRVFAE